MKILGKIHLIRIEGENYLSRVITFLAVYFISSSFFVFIYNNRHFNVIEILICYSIIFGTILFQPYTT